MATRVQCNEGRKRRVSSAVGEGLARDSTWSEEELNLTTTLKCWRCSCQCICYCSTVACHVFVGRDATRPAITESETSDHSAREETDMAGLSKEVTILTQAVWRKSQPGLSTCHHSSTVVHALQCNQQIANHSKAHVESQPRRPSQRQLDARWKYGVAYQEKPRQGKVLELRYY
eukprot:SM000129S26133  [mRNA]  locus=s129:116533:121472:+ [translate_table: standard]